MKLVAPEEELIGGYYIHPFIINKVSAISLITRRHVNPLLR